MATNNTATATTPPPASQVEAQSIVGQPPVQARPTTAGQVALASTSITGSFAPAPDNSKKGKGNN